MSSNSAAMTVTEPSTPAEFRPVFYHVKVSRTNKVLYYLKLYGILIEDSRDLLTSYGSRCYGDIVRGKITELTRNAVSMNIGEILSSTMLSPYHKETFMKAFNNIPLVHEYCKRAAANSWEAVGISEGLNSWEGQDAYKPIKELVCCVDDVVLRSGSILSKLAMSELRGFNTDKGINLLDNQVVTIILDNVEGQFKIINLMKTLVDSILMKSFTSSTGLLDRYYDLLKDLVDILTAINITINGSNSAIPDDFKWLYIRWLAFLDSDGVDDILKRQFELAKDILDESRFPPKNGRSTYIDKVSKSAKDW